MLKYALLAGAMIVSAPAMAQQTPAKPQTLPAAQPAPATQTDPAQAQATAPQSAAPAQDSTATTTATDPATPAQAAPAQAAQAAPLTKAQQIAQVVDTEFASYDKDKNGVLSATEFDAWMVALKTAADPTTKADAPATKTWLTQAFAQADTDKNKTVSKAELNGFLVAGNS
jgi:hypothetical protein